MAPIDYRQRFLRLLENIGSDQEYSLHQSARTNSSRPLAIPQMAVELIIDSQIVRVTHAMDGQRASIVFIECRLGRAREADELSVHGKLLSTNYAMSAHRESVFSIDPINEDIIYTLSCSLDDAEPDHFAQSVFSAAALIPSWRTQLRLVESLDGSITFP